MVGIGSVGLDRRAHRPRLLASVFTERGTMWLTRTKMAVAAAALLAFIACAHFMGMVLTGEKEWLAQCPPESRKAVHELGLSPDEGVAVVLPGPHIIIQPYHRGLEVQDGPVEVTASIPARGGGKEAFLYGVIRTGSDGATIHFNKMRLFQQSDTRGTPPSGPERDICAVGVAVGDPKDPGGIPKVEITPPPDYKPHPGFLFVTNERLNILFAD